MKRIGSYASDFKEKAKPKVQSTWGYGDRAKLKAKWRYLWGVKR